MPYIKLTSKLRKLMDDLDQRMRASGYKADLRWIEKGECPLCDQTGSPIGTISAVTVPEAGMIYIPYSLCAACVIAHPGAQNKGFGSATIEKIESTIFTALGINRDGYYMNRLTESLADQVVSLVKLVEKEGIPTNPTWLQFHTFECPGCGQTMEEPAKAGVSIAQFQRGIPVAIPYLVCPACARYSDERLNMLVQDRLLTAIGRPNIGGTAH